MRSKPSSRGRNGVQDAQPLYRYRLRMNRGVLVVVALVAWAFAVIVVSMLVANDLRRGWVLVLLIGVVSFLIGLLALQQARVALDPPEVLLLYRDRCEFRMSHVSWLGRWFNPDRIVYFADVGGVETWSMRTRYRTIVYLRFRLLPRGAGSLAGYVDIPIDQLDVAPLQLQAQVNALLFPATAALAPERMPRLRHGGR